VNAPRPPRWARLQRSAGFTLIEWMITAAVLMLLVTLAAPSVRDLIAEQRLRSAHAALVTDLQYVRTEADRQRRSLRFEVGGNDTMTCYIVFAPGMSGMCRCTNPPGDACRPRGTSEEMRTVQFPRSSGLTVTASSSRGPDATFEEVSGRSEPGDLRIELAGSVRGRVRVMVNAAGRVSSCTPDGSVRQVATCS
jgi:type IV fimbrial biogenesis protein FimT